MNSYKIPHPCTPAPLLQGERVMEALMISKSTGDTSFSGAPQRYTLSRIMTGVMTVKDLNNCVALMYEH